MSFSQTFSQVVCQVNPGFNLEQYCLNLHNICISENNFIVQQYGIVDDLVDIMFGDYLSQEGNQVTISFDSEEDDHDVYTWICQNIRDEMSSIFQISQAVCIGSESAGMSVSFVDRRGRVHSMRDIFRILDDCF